MSYWTTPPSNWSLDAQWEAFGRWRAAQDYDKLNELWDQFVMEMGVRECTDDDFEQWMFDYWKGLGNE